MSETKHTPTPWKVADDGTVGGVWTADGDTQVAQTQEVSVRDRLQGSVIRKANAEFIVRACNSHDDLLDACKRLMSLVAEAICHGMPITREVADARNLAVTTIAKAEGRV